MEVERHDETTLDDILSWATSLLATTPKRWKNLIEALPDDLISRPPAPNEWSALNCLEHLVEAEIAVFPIRVKALLSGTPFPAFDPDSQGTVTSTGLTPLDLVTEFARLRHESLSLLATVTPPDLDLKGQHPELGPITLGELVHNWLGHDLMHTVQAERALMQPFIQGCGPWRAYYVDHIVEPKRTP